MAEMDEFSQRARATWVAGDWDRFSRLIKPVGEVVLERVGAGPGLTLLDVGTGSGGTIAIPAALRGAVVVGADVTPELFDHARRRAADAGVEIEWIEADARFLPFDDDSFDRVVSTFGAMFAPDHARAAAELVRVCRPGGTVAMTTWANEGFAGELFKLIGGYAPPPPPGALAPAIWGVEQHAVEMFAAAGAAAAIVRETVRFEFASVAAMVAEYSDSFGPFVIARRGLEPAGRWDEFIGAFTALVERFDAATGSGAAIDSGYLLITATV